jgi:hypothetical protein
MGSTKQKLVSGSSGSLLSIPAGGRGAAAAPRTLTLTRQAVPDLFFNGPFPAIPRDNNDTKNTMQIQAIANTAAFHFAFIEVGGTSLYPTLALRVTDPVVLRILLSIGPSETMHFQTWSDKAGNAVSPPFNVKFGKLTFPNLSPPSSEDLQTNLIMPEPCPFLTNLNSKFPAVSIIRPGLDRLDNLRGDGGRQRPEG